jgi:ubiquitin conjugation factor E4 B
LSPSDIDQFLQDFARRFEPDNEMDDILGPVVRGLLFHESLFRPEGLGGGDASWRGVISGLEVLVSIKSIAAMITRMEDWNPPNATATTFETSSLMGPLCRLGVFFPEWVCSDPLICFCGSLAYPFSQVSHRHTSLTPIGEQETMLNHRMPA